jgi:NADH dehydrogenase FAD-containing subunit
MGTLGRPKKADAARPGGTPGDGAPVQAGRTRGPKSSERVRRVVIVGASLAGLRAAATLRREGYDGSLTLIGDEPCEPYDRPPLSKQVLSGQITAGHTMLPRRGDLDAEWLRGKPATGLDLAAK